MVWLNGHLLVSSHSAGPNSHFDIHHYCTVGYTGVGGAIDHLEHLYYSRIHNSKYSIKYESGPIFWRQRINNYAKYIDDKYGFGRDYYKLDRNTPLYVANNRLGHLLQSLYLVLHNVRAHLPTIVGRPEFRIFDGRTNIHFGYLAHNPGLDCLHIRKLLLLPQNGRLVLRICELVATRSILDHFLFYNRPHIPIYWL